MPKPIIAIDADGVLLDYRKAFPAVYERAFKKPLPLVRPDAYHATTAYGLTLEDGSLESEQFFAEFGEEAWGSMPMLPGVHEACHALHAAGYDLVCVTSMPTRFTAARARNLRAHDLPFEDVIATGRYLGENPKTAHIEQLGPVAFVDDLAHNFRGTGANVHRALVDYGHFDSPNLGEDLSVVDSHHGSLLEFAAWWLTTRHP